jgi:hypothetical protein
LHARFGPNPRHVVASEYSAALQLSVLGVSDMVLAEPILDVGCGEQATLVRALVAKGKKAHGLDFDAPVDVATAADWLKYPFGNERWGSVLSHQGFSLHFLHYELAKSAVAFDYARVYMSILRSLAPGGLFAYIPSLPFIEQHLARATYKMERQPLPPELRATPALVAVEKTTGLDLGHATHVRRSA